MAYIKEIGENRFGIKKFTVMVSVQNKTRKSATIYAKDIEEAKTIGAEIEGKVIAEKIKILEKKLLTEDEIATLGEFLKKECRKYDLN